MLLLSLHGEPYFPRAAKRAKNVNRRRDFDTPSSTGQNVAERKAVFVMIARMILYRIIDNQLYGTAVLEN